jgi:hypothetical protein
VIEATAIRRIRHDQSSALTCCNRAASLSVLTAGWQERGDQHSCTFSASANDQHLDDVALYERLHAHHIV